MRLKFKVLSIETRTGEVAVRFGAVDDPVNAEHWPGGANGGMNLVHIHVDATADFVEGEHVFIDISPAPPPPPPPPEPVVEAVAPAPVPAPPPPPEPVVEAVAPAPVPAPVPAAEKPPENEKAK